MNSLILGNIFACFLINLCVKERINANGSLMNEEQETRCTDTENRLAAIETKLGVYEAERRQLYKYAEVITEALKRLMKIETETDSINVTLQKMQYDIQELTIVTNEQRLKSNDIVNDLGQAKIKILDVSDTILSLQTDFRDINSSILTTKDRASSTNHQATSNALEERGGGEVTETPHSDREGYEQTGTNLTTNIEICREILNNEFVSVEKEVSHIIQFVNTSVSRLQEKLVTLADRFGPPPGEISTTGVSETIVESGWTGRQFWLTFPQNYNPASTNNWRLYIFATSDSDSEVSIRIHKNNGYTAYLFNKSLTIEINRSFQLLPNTTENKGISVTSEYPIAVSGYSTYNLWLSDACNVIPLTNLGTSYVIVSYHPHPGFHSFISILPTESDTTVQVTLNTTGSYTYNNRNYQSGDSFELYMKQFQSFQLTHTSDLTGTKVISNKPIAVQSGCTRVYPSGFDDDYYLVFLPPLSTLGSLFIIPNFMSAKQMSVRVVPAESSTIVRSNDVTSTYQLKKTSEIDLSISRPSVISCSTPCLIAAYSYFKTKPSTSMTLIPAISQFARNYHYITPHDSFGSYSHYVAIIVRSSQVSGLMINKRNVDEYNPTSETVTVEQTSWTVLTINLDQGTYAITSTIEDSYYGVIAYGLRKYAAYSYSLGMKLS